MVFSINLSEAFRSCATIPETNIAKAPVRAFFIFEADSLDRLSSLFAYSSGKSKAYTLRSRRISSGAEAVSLEEVDVAVSADDIFVFILSVSHYATYLKTCKHRKDNSKLFDTFIRDRGIGVGVGAYSFYIRARRLTMFASSTPS